MQNSKKYLKIFATIILILIILFTAGLTIRNSLIDRYNPFLPREQSYAKVHKGTQKYENITAYNQHDGKLPYTLSFGGYDPSRQYVKITHKGKYVSQIVYVNKNQAPKKVR